MVYLIHFDKHFHHCRHYIGFTDDIDARFKRHQAGDGSRLLRAVKKAGINFHIVRTWEGTRELERKLKKRKNSKCLCPECMKENEYHA